MAPTGQTSAQVPQLPRLEADAVGAVHHRDVGQGLGEGDVDRGALPQAQVELARRARAAGRPRRGGSSGWGIPTRRPRTPGTPRCRGGTGCPPGCPPRGPRSRPLPRPCARGRSARTARIGCSRPFPSGSAGSRPRRLRRVAEGLHLGQRARSSSRVIFRLLCTRSEFVSTTRPSADLVVARGHQPLAALGVTSTRHMRQAP